MTRIQQLEAQQRKYTFYRKRAAINKISIEKLALPLRTHNYNDNNGMHQK